MSTAKALCWIEYEQLIFFVHSLHERKFTFKFTFVFKKSQI